MKHFLGQCLESVYASDLTLPPDVGGGSFQIQVHVVDNASVDGSVEMLQQHFPQVHLTANTDNRGFAAANNIVLRQILDNPPTTSQPTDYILLLNPDTIVERDTLSKCVSFFLSHPDCGGLGVKMINGEGKFLKESKRGFPTPEASFYKITGLIRLFPHHKRIAAYYLGHLPDDQTNPIDILPGAFLMISRPALEKTGLLDESYFMYGEDIDFSWRIRLAGYQNYYFPTTRIIHYKGESTKHASFNYVYTFYNAMSIFVQHYFSGKGAKLFNALLHTAIWTRATAAFLRRIVTSLALPLLDFIIAYAGFFFIELLWSAHQLNPDLSFFSSLSSIFHTDFSILYSQLYYPPVYSTLIIPLYILTLILSAWLYGGYIKPVRIQRIVKGMTLGTLLLLIFYSLLDESLRYSRALLLLGCSWTLISTLLSRAVLRLFNVKGFGSNKRTLHTLIVGSPSECKRVTTLYDSLAIKRQFSVFHDSLSVSKLADAIHYHKADEVIFCNNDHSMEQVIDTMTALADTSSTSGRQIEFKTLPATSDIIIGSNQVHAAEDLFTEQLNAVSTPLNRRNKRLFDIISSLLLLLLSPIFAWFQKSPSQYFRNCWLVLLGRRSWVGDVPKGIYSPAQALPEQGRNLSPEAQRHISLRYQRNYRLSTDLRILIRNIVIPQR